MEGRHSLAQALELRAPQLEAEDERLWKRGRLNSHKKSALFLLPIDAAGAVHPSPFPGTPLATSPFTGLVCQEGYGKQQDTNTAFPHLLWVLSWFILVF